MATSVKLKQPRQVFSQIPKTLHIVWIGDESRRPERWIQTWRNHHPDWQLKIWGNAEYDNVPWRSKRQMDIFRQDGFYPGVSDLMRYEILYEHGGVYVDADSHCLRRFDDWLLDCRLFAAWESERHRPGLIGTSYIGSVAGHPAIKAMIDKTAAMKEKVWRRAWPNPFRYKEVPTWISVGPAFFTKMILPYCPLDATIVPSILLFPQHIDDPARRESSLIYASHEWGSQDDDRYDQNTK